MNKNKIMAIVIAVLAIMVVGLIIGLVFKSTTTESPVKDYNDNIQFVEEDFNIETNGNDNISLVSSPIVVKDGYVTQVLTATVIPASAEDKAVDWSVKWEDSTKTEDVTQYVNVEPQGNGSNKCNVNCYKAFDGKIIVTVTTRVGGFTADCVVTYIGKPSALEIVPTNLTEKNGAYELKPNSSYSLELKQTSTLGDVTSGYTKYVVTMKGTGSVIYSYGEAYKSGGFNWYDGSDEIIAYDTLLSKILTVKATGSYLEISTLAPIEEDFGSLRIIDGGRTKAWSDMFRSYVNDCYIEITVTETNTGLSDTIKIRLEKNEIGEREF